jgi:hypothetical protein
LLKTLSIDNVSTPDTRHPTPHTPTSNYDRAKYSLCVKDIRALGLDVIQDSITHAGITDLYGQTDLQAERLASLLATQSTIISIEDI